MDKKIINISLLAALYVSLCLILEPISFGPLQFRFAEVLCLLSINYSWAIIGSSLGCFISNLLFGGLGAIDVIIGTLATLISCYLAHRFRNIKYKNIPFLSFIIIVFVNAIMIGIELAIIYNNKLLIPLYILQVGLSELLTIIIGIPIYYKIVNIIK